METKQFYVGLDVHTTMTAYAVRAAKGSIVLSGECATRYDDLQKILAPYLLQAAIVVEACTGYYHLYWEFKNRGYDIIVANTLRIRQLVAKSDRLDAERLSDMLRLGSIPPSYVPDTKLMKLRSLVHLRQSFVEESTAIKNKIIAYLTRYGLTIHERTPFGKRWLEQLQHHICEHPELTDLYHTYEHYKVLQLRMDSITAEAIVLAKKHWSKEVELLDSIPGIATILAIYMIAEICPISRFNSVKKLRRYAGVIPCSRESGGRSYGSSLPKSSSRGTLRWALVQASWAATKGNNNLTKYYHKKKKTRPKGKAIMAVASSLTDIIFHVLSTGNAYSSS
jgi:transposase